MIDESMSALIEITGDDIAELRDEDLRDLIGRLCEADYRSAGLSTKGIICGGHQDAPDGGLDVVVQDSVHPPANSHVPRAETGFQVKTSVMPPREIEKEMRPKGELRPSIKTLIRDKGAYIIVSAGSVTDNALKNRLEAMKKAVAGEDPLNDLHLDFFDRNRVATWVRSHRPLIEWVREKTGNLLQGWRPYGKWAYVPGGVEEEYLLDNYPRLYDEADSSGHGLPIEDGLRKLRATLDKPGTSVRLVGLSGMGKTRLAQALFDDSVGDNALNPCQTIYTDYTDYTDISDEPTPAPGVFATRLINDKERIILVIDNCSPKLHRSLTRKIRSRQDSTVSLLTMEYDVRDDLPEETDVFRLEPASKGIIEKLIHKRYPDIGQNNDNAETIAGFSGGNARVAIALAGTVKRGETRLRDQELFERLFWQRHAPNEALLVSAQLCSLVYSFEGEDTHSDKSELRMLASLTDKPVNELYRHVAELKGRDLIQSRGKWRAVLPPAIANWLAVKALESIPPKTIVGGFLNNSSERLLKSFTRRLGYLHDSKEAVGIVDDWLAEGGWIAKSIHKLDYFEMDVLRNIAPVSPILPELTSDDVMDVLRNIEPVSPEKTLAAIERAASGADGEAFVTVENRHAVEFAHLLRHLACQPGLFNRSVKILSRYALSEYRKYKNENFDLFDRYKPIKKILRSLFYIRLSGTQARFKTRARLIEKLVDSGDPDEQELGLILLEAALKTQHFRSHYVRSHYEFDFGARPRDYGYHPDTPEKIVEWFGNAIRLCLRLALSDRSVSGKARKLLASNLRDLWTTAGMVDALEEAAAKIHAQHPWSGGWEAVRKIIRLDSKTFPDDINQRLQALEERLKPNSLLEDGEEAARLGAEDAQNEETLTELLPDLVSKHNIRLLHSFGSGLAAGCLDEPGRLKALYKAIYQAIKAAPSEQRNIDVLFGFIDVLSGFLSVCATEARSFYDSTLDALIDDPVLGEWFPSIQVRFAIDSRGVERLREALEQGRAGIDEFQCLAWAHWDESISDDDRAALIGQILLKEQGIRVALEILRMWFDNQGGEARHDTGDLMVMARRVLSSYNFEEDKPSQEADDELAVIAADTESRLSKHRQEADDELAVIAAACLDGDGPDAAGAARDVCQRLATGIFKYRVCASNYPRLLNHRISPTVHHRRVCASNYPRLLNKLAQLQPRAFLDIFLAGEDAGDDKFSVLVPGMIDLGGHRENPIAQIPDDTLLAWCEEAPLSRYALISSAITPFRQSGDTGKPEWNPVVYRILDGAPDPAPVIENLARALKPKSPTSLHRGDSRADILKERSVLLRELSDHENAKVKALAKREYDSLRKEIGKERQKEKEDRDRKESFE